ncbi:type II secretion system F family protein [Actinocrispum wychmicini]|uniref:Tight adherence protein B n=1 Tax=Actinocrispum wychmicini TaxID=1213861 RepID=A0A4R2K3E8_9PSEU|nr:type II secretion system F family protein [Actinocrispum wychmicini]TCO64279.1 tight adherence protein B [Actinocrispum wychmicini]
MITVLLLLSGAALTWPTRWASRRLRSLLGHRRRPLELPKPNTVVVGVASAVVGGLALGIGGAVAGGLVGSVTLRRWRSRRAVQDRVRALSDLAETLRSLVGELRAGAHPVVAAESVAVDAPPVGAQALRAIAAAARLGGDVESAVQEPLLVDTVHAWALAQRHGLPLADLLAAVVRDLDQRARFARQVQARMAGPRASATILAVLPAVGVGLGEVMGARPLHILSSTTAGQIMLVLGVGLVCAGVAWSARLTRQAVLP